MQKQEARFKAAELEFHEQQLQHVSEEQREAEELIQNSLDSGGLHSCLVPTCSTHVLLLGVLDCIDASTQEASPTRISFCRSCRLYPSAPMRESFTANSAEQTDRTPKPPAHP